MNALTARIASCTTAMLKEIAESLASDFRDGADTALEAVLAELERRLPSAEFVALCDAM